MRAIESLLLDHTYHIMLTNRFYATTNIDPHKFSYK